MKKIVLFDGECNFCNKSVQFIIKRDPNYHFQFASLQSDIGEQLLNDYRIPSHIDSIVLIEDNRAYLQSSAALRICKYLLGFWKGFYIFIIVPSPIRNFIYNFIAKSRYKWLGKTNDCIIPTKQDKKRFLS